ncbi:hypothetical protein GGR56DRAFT_670512 [Xylariaceae sp. FL0804]|nr:hypothetical protein GGR56DRAFT_670512 [Xylariaceae sp. FL0804]
MSAFAIVGTVDVCIKYGEKFLRLCSAFRGAEAEFAERRQLVEFRWLKTEHQLRFMQEIAGLMNSDHRRMWERTTEMLQSKLVLVTAKLESVVKMSDPAAEPEKEDSASKEWKRVMTPKRSKYALFKKSIDEAIAQLDMWQQVADPSWYLLLKIADPLIDQALLRPEDGLTTSLAGSTARLTVSDTTVASSFPATRTIRAGLLDFKGPSEAPGGIFLPAGELEKMTAEAIPYCEAKTATRMSARKGSQEYVLVSIDCPPATNIQTAKRDLRDLARKLQHDDPSPFGLLSCKGVIEKASSAPTTTTADGHAAGGGAPVSFTMVFRAPWPQVPNRPRSIRDLLVTGGCAGGGGGIALSDKFDVARQLATSISYVHTFGFVHKNIRPETVVAYHRPPGEQEEEGEEVGEAGGGEEGASPSPPPPLSPPSVFLIGFGNFRKDEGRTYRIGDDDWWKNLYRHPSRQGSTPIDEYVMQHDIYSLGVCLLEIGLWESFVSYIESVDEGKNISHLVPSAALELPTVAAAREAGVEVQQQPKRPHNLTGDQMKEHLVRLARRKLPRFVGPRYAAVVETCLTCLDRHNTDFGDETEFLDADRVLVGVRYIEKVLSKLNAITV